MNFIYPEFLFALTAISVPIVIHLFNFRRFKKVYFSDIRFLKNVEIETRSRNQLKNLLILLSRILAVACLVAAFAQPVIPVSNVPRSAADASVVIYIDNSFSMTAQGERGTLLEEAIAKALEVGSVYANSGNIRLLTNDFAPEHSRDLSWEEFKGEVTRIVPSPQVRAMSEVVARAESSVASGKGLNLFAISDLQRTTTDISIGASDSTTAIYIIPIEAEIESNLFIDSCWFNDPVRLPQQPDLLMARVRNESDEELENVSVTLKINGRQRAVGTATIQPHSYEDVELAFTNEESGMQLAEVSLADYPITYDDHYYLSFGLAKTIRVLNVSGDDGSNAIINLFADEPSIQLTTVSATSVDFALLQQTDLLICNGIRKFPSGMISEFMRFANAGGDVLILPSDKQELSSLNELHLALNAEQFSDADTAKLKVEGVNLQSQLYKNVFVGWEERIDLPSVSKHFGTVSATRSSREQLLTLSNGAPLLNGYGSNEGHVYTLTTVLKDEWTNFHRHAIFVPTLFNMALNSVSNDLSAEPIGSNDLIPFSKELKDEEVLELKPVGAEGGFVPEVVKRADATGIVVHGQVKTDGHYLLINGQDTVRSVSFNYDRVESTLDFIDPDELLQYASENGIENISIIDGSVDTIANSVSELHEGKKLWKLFLLLALGFLLIETLLIRLL